jgi:hypothetical protein
MSSVASLSAKPWEGYPAPHQLAMPRGMIGAEERRMLYWLAAEYYSGAGVVVDAGAYLGASAFALATGLAESRHAAAAYAVVHSYDRFVAADDYVRNDITNNFFPVGPDYDYFGIFQSQTALCRDKIVAHRGDFLTAPVPDAPIEILFIDVANTPFLNAKLVEHYFPRLIPGKSVIVQQDFYQAWYPYIPITMEYLSDYLSVVDSYIPNSSRLYHLSRKIPVSKIRQLVDGLDVEEERELLRRAIEKDSSLTRMMLRVVEILHLVDRQRRPDEAQKALTALRRDPEFQANAYYATQLEIIRQSRQLP